MSKSLCNKRVVDYKKLHEGSFDSSVMSESSVVTNQPKSPGKTDEYSLEGLGAVGGSLGSGETLKITVDAAGESDTECVLYNMNKELKNLTEEKAKLIKIQQLSKSIGDMRLQVLQLQGQVVECSDSDDPKVLVHHKVKAKSKVKFGAKPKKIQPSKGKADGGLSLGDLNKDKYVQEKVENKLKQVTLDFSDLSDNSNSSSGSSSEEDSDSSGSSGSDKRRKDKKKRGKGSKLRSGMVAKNSDEVRFPQLWPQKGLKQQFVTSRPKFRDLDFRLLMAGELEIISREGISAQERKGRLSLLKDICYHQSTYEWEALRDSYASALKNVELGLATWDDNLFRDSYFMLEPFMKKPFQKKGKSGSGKVDGAGKTDKVWFCKDYNRNRCSYKESHKHSFQGRSIYAQHICAVCWLKDKSKLQHPECSSACPHAVSN